jgi:hypothetical protein
MGCVPFAVVTSLVILLSGGSAPPICSPVFSVRIVNAKERPPEPSFGIALDPYGRFHDMEYRILDKESLAILLRSALCTREGKCSVEVEITDWNSESASSLIKAILTIQEAANPKAVTTVNILVPQAGNGERR